MRFFYNKYFVSSFPFVFTDKERKWIDRQKYEYRIYMTHLLGTANEVT